MTNFQQEMPVF